MKFRLPILIIVFLLFGCTQHAVKKESSLSAREVVQLFIDSYGTDKMKALTPYLTDEFMRYKPPEVWATRTLETLRSIGYEREQGNIVKETLDGQDMVIIVDAAISTIVGYNKQVEAYLLVKDQSKGWQIDALVVKD